MNNPLKFPSVKNKGASRGAALIITLSILLLVTVLVVALFQTVTTERTESAAAADQGGAQRMATSVVELVKSTITEATMGYAVTATGSANTAAMTAWASQPGLIRTWDQNGNPERTYRLYSSGTIATTGTLDLNAELTDLTKWKSTAPSKANSFNALWCDLNAPVVVKGSGTNTSNVYPIVTPPADKNSGSVAIDEACGVPTANPASLIPEGVQGFKLTGTTPGFVTGTTCSPVNNPAPMPVKWLYVLQNGSFVSPTGSGSTSTVTGATKDNPIVGRVAYWTDDETCKVNLNTASEGVFWDTPKGGGVDEVSMALNQPMPGEWQRIPGHPATTSLSAVFPKLGGETDLVYYQRLASYNPRVSGSAGSLMATLPCGAPLSPSPWFPGVGGVQALPSPFPTAVTLQSKRLLATPDELLFDHHARTELPEFAASGTIRDKLERLDFFLTASSRAPDVNLFNQPRISLWPITWIPRGDWAATTAGTPNLTGGDPSGQPITNNPSMEPSEKLIAYASSLGVSGTEPTRYFFTRQLSMSPTYDYFNIKRNQELYLYLRDRLKQNIPGFGGSLDAHWSTGGVNGGIPSDTDQILTNTFDFLRSTVNLMTTPFQSTFTTGSSNYYYTPRVWRSTFFNGNAVQQAGYGQVVPIQIPSSTGTTISGMGRFPTITAAALVFYAKNRQDCYDTITASTGTTGAMPCPPELSGSNITSYTPRLLSGNYISSGSSQTTSVGMVLLFEMFNPVVGLPLADPMYGVRVSGPNPFTINGASTGFPDGGRTNVVNCVNAGSGRTDDISAPFYGIHSPFWYETNPTVRTSIQPKRLALKTNFPAMTSGSALAGADAVGSYPFYSNLPVSVNPGSNSFSFGGGTLKVEIYAPNTTNRLRGDPVSGTPVRTLTLNFPSIPNLPMPTAPRFFDGQPLKNVATGTMSTVAASGTGLGIPLQEISKLESSANPSSFRYNYGYTSGTGGVVLSVQPLAAYVGTDGTLGHREYNNRIRSMVGYSGTTNMYSSPSFAVWTPYDTVISLELTGTGITQGDPRMAASQTNIPPEWFSLVPFSRRGFIDNGYGGTSFAKITITAATVTGAYVAQIKPGGTGGDSTSTPGFGLAESFMPDNLGPIGSTGRTNNSTLVNSDTYITPIVSGRFGKDGWPNSGLPSNPLPDWENATGFLSDGAIISKPEEVQQPLTNDLGTATSLNVPFFTPYMNTVSNPLFSPNRQIASGVDLGCIPSGVQRNQPWQTLLFCPNPLASGTHHGFGLPVNGAAFGALNYGPPFTLPPDELFADLFTMPVAEPYPISESMSTAGKVNLNYRIAPFSYIERKTSLYAVLKSTKITAITGDWMAWYKSICAMTTKPGSASSPPYSPWSLPTLPVPGFGAVTPSSFYVQTTAQGRDARVNKPRTRFDINIDKTLGDFGGFDTKFDAGDLFRSESQICEMFLVPDPQRPNQTNTVSPGGIPTDLASTKRWWSQASGITDPYATGDNSRESPYKQILPRVTTKSNSYTVHYRVQVLKEIPPGRQTKADWETWSETRDQVVSESRGSASIERYVDPNDSTIPDFAQPANYSKNLAPYYHWRTVSTRQFMP